MDRINNSGDSSEQLDDSRESQWTAKDSERLLDPTDQSIAINAATRSRKRDESPEASDERGEIAANDNPPHDHNSHSNPTPDRPQTNPEVPLPPQGTVNFLIEQIKQEINNLPQDNNRESKVELLFAQIAILQATAESIQDQAKPPTAPNNPKLKEILPKINQLLPKYKEKNQSGSLLPANLKSGRYYQPQVLTQACDQLLYRPEFQPLSSK